MFEKLLFLAKRLRERLWVKPLLFCLLSVTGVFLAKAADGSGLVDLVPAVSRDSVESLLQVMAASMLVIATFAVGSMVSAYASASSTATPRSFSLIVADDVSQNALSAFIGAFIFSIVALIALKNDYYDKAGMFTLFALTLGVFVGVLATFVRWVDQIARLGRLGATVERVEAAASDALERRRRRPWLGGVAVTDAAPGAPVHGAAIGYVQHVAVSQLNDCARSLDARVTVAALPGTFLGPGQTLAWVAGASSELSEEVAAQIVGAFLIGDHRVFDDDPRFGLIALSEIAARALSPAVNDPGTAIGITGTFVRLFARWAEPFPDGEAVETAFERVYVPEVSVEDMFDDAFTAIARDGAGTVEVAIRLQKALAVLAEIDHPGLRAAARRHSRLALARASAALTLPEDGQAVEDVAKRVSAA